MILLLESGVNIRSRVEQGFRRVIRRCVVAASWRFDILAAVFLAFFGIVSFVHFNRTFFFSLLTVLFEVIVVFVLFDVLYLFPMFSSISLSIFRSLALGISFVVAELCVFFF